MGKVFGTFDTYFIYFSVSFVRIIFCRSYNYLANFLEMSAELHLSLHVQWSVKLLESSEYLT